MGLNEAVLFILWILMDVWHVTNCYRNALNQYSVLYLCCGFGKIVINSLQWLKIRLRQGYFDSTVTGLLFVFVIIY
jgi:hypothetical protein